MKAEMTNTKFDEKEFNLWLLDVAPDFIIDLFHNKKEIPRSKMIKSRTLNPMLRKKKILEIAKQGHLSFKVSLVREFFPVFDWCIREQDELEGVKVVERDVSKEIHARYEEAKMDNVQQLALQLFINDAFEEAYALYEKHKDVQPAPEAPVAEPEVAEVVNDTDTRALRKKIKKLEKTIETLKKDKVAAEERARQSKKESDDKARQAYENSQQLKKLEDSQKSSEAQWAADKQAKLDAEAKVDGLEIDIQQWREKCSGLEEALLAAKREITSLEMKNNNLERQLQNAGKVVLDEEKVSVLIDNMYHKNEEGYTVIQPEPLAVETETVATIKPATPVVKQRGTIALLGNPKSALNSLAADKRQQIDIYEASDMAHFMTEVQHYEKAVVFEMRCDKQIFEATAPAHVTQRVHYAKTVMELVQLMGDM